MKYYLLLFIFIVSCANSKEQNESIKIDIIKKIDTSKAPKAKISVKKNNVIKLDTSNIYCNLKIVNALDKNINNPNDEQIKFFSTDI